MGWLTGYDKRKRLRVNGSSAGAQTDYPMQMTVHKSGAPFSVEALGLALYESGIYPHGYYYNGKTYVVWQGSGLDPYIDCYTHATGLWAGAVKVGTNPLSNDNHGIPCVIVDNSGYIHVFYGCHSTPIEYAKSTNTEDISAWTTQTDIAINGTYTSVIKKADGNLYLFAREYINPNFTYTYTISTDWGTTYTIIQSEAAGDVPYVGNAEYDSSNERVHLAWTYYDLSDGINENIYHAYLNLADGKMYAMDGTDLGTTITYAEAEANCKIVSDAYAKVGHPPVHIDSNGYPYIMYRTDSAGGWKTYLIYWNGSAWTSPAEIAITYQDFKVNSASDIDIYGRGTSSADMEEWNWNGSSFSKTRTLLDSAYGTGGEGLYGANLVMDGVAAFNLMFCTRDETDYTNADLWVMGLNSSGEFIPANDRVDLGENCQDDFDDVRFTKSDGETELDFWIEESAAATGALLWVELDAIPASPSVASFYLYYDNALATAGSNGDDTFLFFDDFPGASIDGDKWNTFQGATPTVSGGLVDLLGDSGTPGGIDGKTNISLPAALHSRSYWGSNDVNSAHFHALRKYGDWDYRVCDTYANDIADQVGIYSVDAGSLEGNSTVNIVTPTSYHKWRTLWIAENNAYLYQEGTELAHHTAEVPDDDMCVILRGGVTDSEHVYIDWVFVRKYANPEPTLGGFGDWTGKINGITNPAQFNGIAVADIAKVNGVA